MRHREDARVILVNKIDLISKIKENKDRHVKEYKEAVDAYNIEAKKQLKEQLKKLSSGDLDISLKLVKPINNSEEYDKLVTMFNWELKDQVELSQGEFNEYILDEVHFSIQARMSNQTYIKKLK